MKMNASIFLAIAAAFPSYGCGSRVISLSGFNQPLSREPAVRLRIGGVESSLANQCSGAVTISRLDAADIPTMDEGALTLSLPTVSHVQFYSTANCSTAPLTTATISLGQGSTTLYFRGTAVRRFAMEISDPDLGTASESLRVYSAEFEAPVSYGLAGGGAKMDTGDVNGDGIRDVLIVHDTTAGFSVLFGNSAGTFPTAPTVVSVGEAVHSIVLGDVDGDGDKDVVLGSQANPKVLIYKNNGAGIFTSFSNCVPSFDGVRGVRLGDLDGDGDLDLVTSAWGDVFWDTFLNNGSGTFGSRVSRFSGSAAFDIYLADINSDGNLDIVNVKGDIRFGDGLGGFGAMTDTPTLFSQWSQGSALTDFNGDGFLDIALGVYSGAQLLVSLGSGTGVFGAATQIGTPSQPIRTISADYNGDTRPDLAVALDGSALLSLWDGNGNGAFTENTPIYIGTGTADDVLLHDLNGDGKLDLIGLNRSQSNLAISIHR